MLISGKDFQTIWPTEDQQRFEVIDQRLLPFQVSIKVLSTWQETAEAIHNMTVRGAPLIGATGAAGVYLGLLSLSPLSLYKNDIQYIAGNIKSTRPTAVNLMFAVDKMVLVVQSSSSYAEACDKVFSAVLEFIATEKEYSRMIGIHGVSLLESLSQQKNGEPVNVLTHCNAGWLACIDYGTATAPIYEARKRNIDIHVWVDETRPRNQGSKLTAWEFGQQGIPHTIIADNTGGHLMQHGMVDMVIVGSDRTTVTGDVANKIGTYLKALAAFDNHIPFYAAMPSSTIDWTFTDGIRQITIEERDGREVAYMEGEDTEHTIREVRIAPPQSPVCNFAFDVTPARLVTGIITERGICKADRNSILSMFPEKR